MRDFFSALFDLSFKKFVTPQLAKYIFIISIITAGVSCLFILKASPAGFIMAPLVFITEVIFIRVMLECVMAIFQIARYSAELARRGRTADINDPLITDDN